ncbi:MAG TPA: pyridoxamine 5'-phosphate oxidase family protein [Acidimicrobiales bacterium]|jgi:uncharacterized protein|nr:pyridoxamine 5'-phosphate oxidase family protein [Acidimicrobiales bacterium]
MTGMEILSREECFRLLASRKVGRLGFMLDDQPLVLPVNYSLVRDIVVFRTGSGAKLGAAVGHKVAFEVDSGGEGEVTGVWSVLVQGVAEDITDAADALNVALREGAIHPWVSDVRDHYIRVIPHVISGRWLGD